MALYTQEEKTTIFLSLSENNIPIDIANVIWNNVMDDRKKEIENKPPSAPMKKGISERTQKMMDRWRRNGQWIRHVRNVQFEEMDPRFLQYN